MTSPQKEAPSSGINLGDIYHTVFRHKWLIAGFSLAGVIAAVAVFFVKPPLYVSEARIMVSYVQDLRMADPSATGGQLRSNEERGDAVLASEIEILTSLDNLRTVAKDIGPKAVLAKSGGGANLEEAAQLLADGLKVEIPRRSKVIRVSLAHPIKEVAQKALDFLVTTYIEKHKAVHRPSGTFSKVLEAQAAGLEVDLENTARQLNKLKADSGIFSLEASRKAAEDKILRIEQDIYNAEADLAERKAMLAELTRKSDTNVVAGSTNVTDDPRLLQRYRSLCMQLESLQGRELSMAATLTDQNPQLVQLRAQIEQLEASRASMEEKNPRLAMARVTAQDGKSGFDPVTESARVAVLDAKIRNLRSKLDEVRTNALTLDQSAILIEKLQRDKQFKEARHKYFTSSAEQLDSEMQFSKEAPNIQPIQLATTAVRDWKLLIKGVGLALAAGIFGGIGLAFGIEMFLDQSIRRPADFHKKVNLPLFVTIPDAGQLNGNGHNAVLGVNRMLKSGDIPVNIPSADSSMAVATWSADHTLRPYFEALRDRLVMHFGDDPHKPKLVAVSGFAQGAGVTTIASGLAATLSETGDGRVLLVDMTMSEGAAHPFLRGKPEVGLPELMENATPADAQVSENLYMASVHTGDAKTGMMVPRKFSELVPKLKAADYDYIIFDMPPLTQTSVTPRLSNLMDLVLLVVEAGKTNSELVKQAGTLLSGSKAEVSAVLNKRRHYVPASLQQEL